MMENLKWILPKFAILLVKFKINLIYILCTPVYDNYQFLRKKKTNLKIHKIYIVLKQLLKMIEFYNQILSMDFVLRYVN